MPRVDVVVVSYNSRGSLRACLESFAGDPEVNVVVVDNASTDGSLEAIDGLGATRIRLPDNRGFGPGSNVGWRSGSAPYVLFLNPDARIGLPALRRLVEALESRPEAGAVGPRISDERGTLDRSIRRFPRVRSTYAQALYLHRIFPNASWSGEVVHDASRYGVASAVEWLSGACLLVRRSVLESLGGFDERFFLYCEDKDLCRRIWDAGLEVWFEPAAEAVHEGGASAPRSSLLRILAESRIRYARKHLAAGKAVAEQLGIGLGALTHLLLCRGGRPARSGHYAALRVAASYRHDQR